MQSSYGKSIAVFTAKVQAKQYEQIYVPLSELTHSPLPACSALRKKGLSALVSALDSALPGTFVTKCLEVEVVEVSKLEQVFTFVNSYL